MSTDAGSSSVAGVGRKLVGHEQFKLLRASKHRQPTDKFSIISFHSLEFYCQDATNTSKRFQSGLGMQLVAKSDLSTGNRECASYVLRSQQLVMVFTAPYYRDDDGGEGEGEGGDSLGCPIAGFCAEEAHRFVKVHGLAVRAVAIRVADAADAYAQSIANGAQGVLAPATLRDEAQQSQPGGTTMCVAEISLIGDTVIRFVSGGEEGEWPYLPRYLPVPAPVPASVLAPVASSSLNADIGIERLDHAVSNVPSLFEAVDRLMRITGLHEFSEFTAEDVGTVDSGLNSMVLASDNEMVLLPFNEPTHGTRRKSQIQTYLDHNHGPGIQHLALKTNDIFHTVREMRLRLGGFEFMPPPGQDYYKLVPGRIGLDTLSSSKLDELQELGLLADRDDQGVLLQIFTRPVGDRPTLFLEIIQRIGCDVTPEGAKKEQAAGCGGFGKGNFSELFKSIEKDFGNILE